MTERRRDDATSGAGRSTGGTWTGRGAPPPGRHGPPPAPPDRYRYAMSDLEELTGFNARTIRFYVSQGLLAPAHGRGPSATYDLGHLTRLRAIQLLKDQFLPLNEIKEQLGRMSDQQMMAMLEVETRPPEDRWRRIELHADIELHVRDRGRERDEALEGAVRQIVDLARSVLDHTVDRR